MRETQTRTTAPGRAAPASPVSRVEWAEVHRRLQSVAEALELGWAPGPEETRRILRARAAALARETRGTPGAGEHLGILEFLLAHEKYGVETQFVTEVYPLKEFTPLPGAPAFVLGAVNVRGQILTVVDIKKFFDLPERGLTELNKVILLRVEKVELGVLADVVLGVRSIPIDNLRMSLPTLKGIREKYLKAVTDETVVIVDAQKLLEDRKIMLYEQNGEVRA